MSSYTDGDVTPVLPMYKQKSEVIRVPGELVPAVKLAIATLRRGQLERALQAVEEVKRELEAAS